MSAVTTIPTKFQIRHGHYCLWSLAVVMVLFCLSAPVVGQIDSVPNRKQERPKEFKSPCIIEFKGDIDWHLSKYVRSKVVQAQAAGHDLVVLDIDSPGGLKTESLNLAEMMRDIDWAYTVAFVPREALSGAALVSLGCDEMIIDETARFGDIGVIQFDPQLFAFRFAPEKIQSVLIRQARDLASSKGRSPELAEAMIKKEFHVYTRTVDGKTEFLGLNDIDLPPEDGGWEIVPETKKGFLTINGTRAKQLGMATVLAKDRTEMSQQLGFELVEARVMRYTTTDTVVYWLNHPIGTGLLILIGLIAFFTELSAPGFGVGGMISGLCAVLFFWSRFLGGTSNWLEIVLFCAGMAFILMELFVIPGWGVSGLLGLFMTVASVLMASQDFVIPNSGRQLNQFLTSLLIMLCSGGLFTIAAVFIIRHFGHIPIFNKLMLTPPETEIGGEMKSDKIGSVMHPPVSVGDWGKAESLLRPAGRAVFAGRSFDVVSDGEFIEPDSQVKVIDIQGNRIVVSAISEEESG